MPARSNSYYIITKTENISSRPKNGYVMFLCQNIQGCGYIRQFLRSFLNSYIHIKCDSIFSCVNIISREPIRRRHVNHVEFTTFGISSHSWMFDAKISHVISSEGIWDFCNTSSYSLTIHIHKSLLLLIHIVYKQQFLLDWLQAIVREGN